MLGEELERERYLETPGRIGWGATRENEGGFAHMTNNIIET